ncbi:MAG: MCE family protein, partial [Actinobacteria bacterium]|nr:MCE family protein [Actinomycetota bacterium]
MAVGESFATAVKRRLLGLLLLVVIAGLVTLSIAIYNKAFSTYVEISIRFDYTGNQLMANSDVKERGVLVGSVKSVSSTGDGAVVRVNLDPSRVGEIPSNVTAQILPKTLFGEQYVALNYPQDPAAPIRAGDVIPQDRSQGAL